jgi:hypothetical protein
VTTVTIGRGQLDALVQMYVDNGLIEVSDERDFRVLERDVVGPAIAEISGLRQNPDFTHDGRQRRAAAVRDAALKHPSLLGLQHRHERAVARRDQVRSEINSVPVKRINDLNDLFEAIVQHDEAKAGGLVKGWRRVFRDCGLTKGSTEATRGRQRQSVPARHARRSSHPRCSLKGPVWSQLRTIEFPPAAMGDRTTSATSRRSSPGCRVGPRTPLETSGAKPMATDIRSASSM